MFAPRLSRTLVLLRTLPRTSTRLPSQAHRSMTTPAGTHARGALTAAIAEDHEEMYGYHEQYKTARSAGDADAQARWARQLIWEVARHAVGEEIVVYPLMEKHMGAEGKRLADEDRSEHQVRVPPPPPPPSPLINALFNLVLV